MAIQVVFMVFKNIAKVIKEILFNSKFGLINPKSITFIWLSLPTFLLLMSTHEKRYSKPLASGLLGIDIPEKFDPWNNNNHKTELVAAFLSFLLLTQIIYAPLIIHSSSVVSNLKQGKLSKIAIQEIPSIVFRIVSIIVVPRTIQLFIKNNVYFESPEHSLIASNMSHTLTTLFVISHPSIWNPISTIASLVMAFFTIRFNERDVSIVYPTLKYDDNNRLRMVFQKGPGVKTVVKAVVGGEYPRFTSSADDKVLYGFMFSLFIVLLSALLSRMDLVPIDESIITLFMNMVLVMAIPMFFRNMAKYPSYQSELNTLGTLLGMFVPLAIQSLRKKY
jgi:hypothetical protein